jgi:hypothetical protein
MHFHSVIMASSGSEEPNPDNHDGVNRLADIKYEIKESIGVLSESAKGWKKELNLISWNDRDPKYDIREWAQGHEKMGKGITFSAEELKALREVLSKMTL